LTVREIHAVSVGRVLTLCLLERLERHVGIPPDPAKVGPRLRHHDDGRITLREAPDRAADADFRLDETVEAALAASVQEEHDGPAPVARVVSGNVDLIAVGLTGNCEGSIRKPVPCLAGQRPRSQYEHAAASNLTIVAPRANHVNRPGKDDRTADELAQSATARPSTASGAGHQRPSGRDSH
jgi:hypothetical protein